MATIRVLLQESRDESYDVIVGRDLVDGLPGLLKEHCPAGRYAIIADHHVAELHGGRLLASLTAAGIDTRIFTFPAGEWNKNREQWADLTDQLMEAKFGRDSAVIAFGGGVAGDLAGFVAATYQRGLPFVQVPTSLLAMIDASVGGKTGVDIPAGKNLVGAFHQPRLVVADIAHLATLPRTHISAGMAEAIKHGAILDAAYFASLADSAPCLAKNLDRLEQIVTRSIQIKAGVVSSDAREGGRRQILNFGHTIGHALETLSGFDLLHGEGVAIGMAVEAKLAEESGIAKSGTAAQIIDLLERYQLPDSIPDGIGAERLVECMRADKKVRAGRIRFALPAKIGSMAQSADGAWTVEVESEVLGRAISL
ncbi:MAG TPA: 3-dehydroquinate synthase [Gemmatimonadales bacterium]|jgi:3-dehydroquinate synthase